MQFAPKPAVQNSTINHVAESTQPPVNPNANRRVNQPLGTSRGSSFSLKNARIEKQDNGAEEEVYRDDLPRNPYTIEQVKGFWSKFLDRLKIEHNIPAYNALSTTEIHLKEDNIIQLEFISASSETEFEIYRNRIMNGLRNAIQNFYFTIEVKFSEAEAKSHILTTKEKFEKFAAKNPVILRLKEEFGLDLYE